MRSTRLFSCFLISCIRRVYRYFSLGEEETSRDVDVILGSGLNIKRRDYESESRKIAESKGFGGH